MSIAESDRGSLKFLPNSSMSSSSSLDVESAGAGGTKGESGLSSLGSLINEKMSSIPLRDSKFGLSASTQQSGHRLCETSHLLTPFTSYNMTTARVNDR